MIMSNLGKVSKVVEKPIETTLKTGGQPGQGLTHGFKKIVHSKPMDLSKVSQSTHLPARDTFQSTQQTFKGGKPVEYQTKDMSGALIDTLDSN